MDVKDKEDRDLTSSVEKKKKEKRKDRKHKKKNKKHKEITELESENHRKPKSKKRKKSSSKKNPKKTEVIESVNNKIPGPSVPIKLIQEQARSKAPMTKEEWEKSQSVIRRVYDENTGRSRLIKGDGEVLEEIVSLERHREINKQATLGDGEYFQNHIRGNK